MELKSGTGNAPAGRIYITEDEYVKCRKVADAFTELYEMTDVMVADAVLGTPLAELDYDEIF